MQSLKPQMCQIDEVPTNCQKERDIATEVPIRMNVTLPPCWVVLHRLTEEEIYRSYPDSYSSSEINADVRWKTDELLDRTVEAVPHKDHDYSQDYEQSEALGKHTLRKFPRVNNGLYESYREKRRRFIKQQDWTFEPSSDSSDMSDDGIQSSGSSEKGRKRGRRGRKYERDSEWCPNSPKRTEKYHYEKRLRKKTRRPVIESDSSSTDQDDILYAIYMNDHDNSNSTHTAYQNSVPSVDEVLSASSATSIGKATVESDLSEKAISAKTCQNSSQTVVNCNTNSIASNTHDSDLLSGIIREMNECKNGTNEVKAPFSSKVQKTPPFNDIKPNCKRGRKRLLVSNDNSEINVNSIVAGILKEMVNKVSFQHRQTDLKNNKIYRKCKWCHTQFSINNINEILCAICRDQGKDKLMNRNKQSKDKILKKSKKNTTVSKAGRKVSAMSQVLKKLPKSDMQRLMYTDKSAKLLGEKGYNHCKSLNISKDVPDPLNDTEERSSHASKLSENVSIEKKNNIMQVQKKSAKEFGSSAERQSTLVKINNLKNTNNIKNNVECEKILPKKPQVSLKKFNEGLFLMSFPDPDKELNLGVQENKLCKSLTENAKMSENLSKCNSSRAIEPLEKSISPSASKKSRSVAKDEQYQTYLLPPVPTVLVANYSSSNDKEGNYRLSSIFYQNKLTQPIPVQNSVNGIPPIVASTTSGLSSILIPTQKVSSSCGHLNNSSLSISAKPLDNSINSVQPFANNSMPIINSFAATSISNSVTIMPIVSSVISLSEDKSTDQTSNLNNTSGTFTNSDQLQIRINHVYSQNTNENKLNKSSSEFNVNNNEKSLPGNLTLLSRSNRISRKRSNSSESISLNKTKLHKENSESDTDISENGGETSEITKNTLVNAETDKNLQNESNKSDLLKNSENSFKTGEQGSNINGQTEANSQSLQRESHKSFEAGDNSSPKDAIKSAIDLLEAVSILAVIDLEKNPRQDLCIRTQMAKNALAKLTNEKNPGPDHNEKIALCQHNLEVLEIALKFLNLYGTFAKVSDHLMRKQKMEKLIQIKKEMLDEEEQEEEETNQTSCRFSQQSQSNNSFNTRDMSKTPNMPSPATIKMESLNSYRLNDQSTAISHIEKIQSQIAAMNNNAQFVNNTQLMNNTQYDVVPTIGTVHHFGEQYGALTPAVAAPASITPRNDCMGGESRETPSRGSGPRTPARPESATSQPEEQSLAAQVKKEQFEASTSPSQCSYSQNSSLTQISSQVPVVQNMSSLNIGGNAIPNNTVQQSAVGGTVNQIFTSGQTNLINRTTSYNNNQNYSNVLVNIASRQPAPTSGVNTNVDQNGQLLIRQQLYLPSGTQITPKQTVPSLNNQYVNIPSYPASSGGNVIMNNSQAGGQNVNALLTNVSNQQFYTSNQVPQLYYPSPPTQLACMQAPNVTVVQNQQPASENMDQMYCAVCKNVATLRCKQCAKVAYCNTTCAKTYWHQKHKMECKPLPS